MKRLVPSPGIVIALVALFVALGGSAFAAGYASHPDAKSDIKLVKKLAPSLSVKSAKTLAPLASGQSESGAFSAGGAHSSGSGGWLGVGITYPRPLAAPIADDHVIDTHGSGSAPHCAGIGQADAGFLCLYNTITDGADLAYMYSQGSNVDGKIGVVVYFPVIGSSPYVGGTWTVTAP